MKNILSFVVLSLTFSTFADTRIVLVGDTGRDNPGQFKVAESMKAVCQKEGCHYGILAGDNVYSAGVSSENDPILETMFDKYYNSLKIPFIVALGNHDYGKDGRTWARGSYQLLHAKKNPLFVLPDYYYLYETPDAIIAVLDTTRLVYKKDFEPQAKLIAEGHQKAVASKKWFMVVGHHPYLSNGSHGNAGRYDHMPLPYWKSGSKFKTFMKDHVCGKADFYLAGHDHNLQVLDGLQAKCNTKLIVSGAGCEVKSLTNRNKADFAEKTLGYFHLALNPEQVKVRAFNDQSKLLFEKDYSKK